MGDDRKNIGARAGRIGMCLNFFLAITKIVIGAVSGSISIIGDGVNNFSDAISSIVTMASFKLAAKKADKEHPFGHGRAEYVSGFIVSSLVIAVALELGKTSISNIIDNAPIDAGILAIVLLVLSIGVKLWMSIFYTKVSRKIGSTTMKAAAVDSRMDCIATSVALISVIIFMLFDVNIDGYAGVAVAIFVLWQGINSAKETVAPLIGNGADDEKIDEIKDIASSHPDVLSVHDIRVHDYGPDCTYVSMHVEIPSNMSLTDAHALLDEIETEIVDKKLATDIVAHPDPVNDDYPGLKELKAKAASIAKNINENISIHDFHIIDHKHYVCVTFDICIPYDYECDENSISSKIKNELSEECYAYIDNDFRMIINVDRG